MNDSKEKKPAEQQAVRSEKDSPRLKMLKARQASLKNKLDKRIKDWPSEHQPGAIERTEKALEDINQELKDAK